MKIPHLDLSKNWNVVFGLCLVILIGFGILPDSFMSNREESQVVDAALGRVLSVFDEPGGQEDGSINQKELWLVTKVIDGDTIEIESGQKVRYIGIDTPETVDPRKEVQCFGSEASKMNSELVAGKEVRLEKDVSETDRYGRLLRYVYVDDVLINEVLVREGFARASSYPPDILYQENFTRAEELARQEQKGLWSSMSQ